MARQTTTTRISTFLVRSLIHDFPKRSMTALARADIPVAGPSKSLSKPLLPEHRIQVLLLHANDLAFAPKISERPSNGAVDKKGRGSSTTGCARSAQAVTARRRNGGSIERRRCRSARAARRFAGAKAGPIRANVQHHGAERRAIANGIASSRHHHAQPTPRRRQPTGRSAHRGRQATGARQSTPRGVDWWYAYRHSARQRHDRRRQRRGH
jgi:hypothetical protein